MISISPFGYVLINSDIDKEHAGELIMTARIPWFENEEATNES